MGKLNDWVLKHRGLMVLAGAGVTAISATVAAAAVLGFGPIPTPRAALVANAGEIRRVESVLQTHIEESAHTHADTERMLVALKVDLCLRYPDDATRARMQIDCLTILRGRP